MSSKIDYRWLKSKHYSKFTNFVSLYWTISRKKYPSRTFKPFSFFSFQSIVFLVSTQFLCWHFSIKIKNGYSIQLLWEAILVCLILFPKCLFAINELFLKTKIPHFSIFKKSTFKFGAFNANKFRMKFFFQFGTKLLHSMWNRRHVCFCIVFGKHRQMDTIHKMLHEILSSHTCARSARTHRH